MRKRKEGEEERVCKGGAGVIWKGGSLMEDGGQWDCSF